ncbi:MAG: hypothetical protein AAFU77_11095 [Myxococcota bacterium]
MTIELDSILSSPPGPETWTRLLQTLESSHGEEVLERCDRVLSGWPEEVEREAPLSWVEALLDGADATRLRLCNLLYLEDVRLGGDALRALAGAPALCNIRGLFLIGAWFLDSGLETLAESPHLRGIRHLSLDKNGFGLGDGLRSLLTSEVVAGVTHLSLNDNLIGSVGLERLGRWERAPRLKHLSLRGVGADQDGVRVLVLTDLSSLERLDLSANRIADEGGRRCQPPESWAASRCFSSRRTRSPRVALRRSLVLRAFRVCDCST